MRTIDTFATLPSERLLGSDQIHPTEQRRRWYLSLGGEARERFELYNNNRWNPKSPMMTVTCFSAIFFTPTYISAHPADIRPAPSSLEKLAHGGPRPIDEDQLDVHQLFADVRLPIELGEHDDFTLRVGRQEMAYGSARLIGVVRRPISARRLMK
jgi:hypothetical protein